MDGKNMMCYKKVSESKLKFFSDQTGNKLNGRGQVKEKKGWTGDYTGIQSFLFLLLPLLL